MYRFENFTKKFYEVEYIWNFFSYKICCNLICYLNLHTIFKSIQSFNIICRKYRINENLQWNMSSIEIKSENLGKSLQNHCCVSRISAKNSLMCHDFYNLIESVLDVSLLCVLVPIQYPFFCKHVMTLMMIFFFFFYFMF